MDKLPEELLVRIIKILRLDPWGEYVRDLPLVNRKFARIVTPLLYERVALDSFSHMYDDSPGSHLKATRRFLSTLVNSRDLRPLVRSLEVTDWQTVDLEGVKNIDIAPVSLADLSDIIRCIPALSSCPPDYQRKFASELMHSSPDAMLAAIFNLLPKLGSVFLEMNHLYDRPTGDIFSRVNFNSTLTMRLFELSATQCLSGFSLFGRLTEVSIVDRQLDESGRNPEETPGWDTNLISFFLRLPVLKTFEGSGFCDMDNGSIWTCNEGVSSVTKITLRDCMISNESIRNVLRSCQALKYFNCMRLCKNCLDGVDGFDYSYAGVHDDLNRHQESLQELFLNSKACYHPNSRDEQPVETLTMLKSLKNLLVDEDVLFGRHEETTRPLIQFLPSNLQDLTVHGELHSHRLGLFSEISRFLLSTEKPPSIHVLYACIRDVDDVLRETPELALEQTIGINRSGVCSLRIYKIGTNGDA